MSLASSCVIQVLSRRLLFSLLVLSLACFPFKRHKPFHRALSLSLSLSLSARFDLMCLVSFLPATRGPDGLFHGSLVHLRQPSISLPFLLLPSNKNKNTV